MSDEAKERVKPVSRATQRPRLAGDRGAGFTLIELMAVVTIIAILAGITLGLVAMVQQKAAKALTLSRITTLAAALEGYNADFSSYPPDYLSKSLSGYASELPHPPGTAGEYIYDSNMADPAVCLWFFLYQMRIDVNQDPYMRLDKSALTHQLSSRNMQVADAYGRPLNYKANYSPITSVAGYSFTTGGINNGPTYEPRHNKKTFDLCSYGMNGVTWSTYDPGANTGTLFKSNELTQSGNLSSHPSDYFYKPFNQISTLSDQTKYSFGGEEYDDINNWQQQ